VLGAKRASYGFWEYFTKNVLIILVLNNEWLQNYKLYDLNKFNTYQNIDTLAVLFLFSAPSLVRWFQGRDEHENNGRGKNAPWPILPNV